MAVLPTKPPIWFWIIAILFLLWNLAGCYACFSQLTMTPQQMATLPEMQRQAWTAMTMAPKAAYVVAVAAGLVGSILLLARRALARATFLLSLIGVIIQFGWFFVAWGGYAKLGPSSVGFPVFIVLMGVVQIWVAGKAIDRGWIS